MLSGGSLAPRVRQSLRETDVNLALSLGIGIARAPFWIRRPHIIRKYRIVKALGPFTGDLIQVFLVFDLKKLDNHPITWFFHWQRQTKPNPSFGPFSNGLLFCTNTASNLPTGSRGHGTKGV